MTLQDYLSDVDFIEDDYERECTEYNEINSYMRHYFITEKDIKEMEMRGLDVQEHILTVFTIEHCPFCDSEQVIFTDGITACSECGKPLAPCSMCDSCDYNTCPYGCDGTDNDATKEITRRIISKEEAQLLYKYL